MKSVRTLAWIVVISINLGLLLYFNNRFWCAADDGLYAHLAERVVHGEVLHKDVQYFCPDFDVFINGAAFLLFGERFASLRYPLVLVSMIQVCLIFSLFSRYNLGAAVVASTMSIVLGILHFLNPTHNWYVLFFAVLIGCYLTWNRALDAKKFFWAGFLVAVIFCFRQLTAVFMAMAVLSYFLLERNGKDIKGERSHLASFIYVLMILGLLMYLYKATDLIGFLLFGFWPICILLWLMIKVRVSNAEVFEILRAFVSGSVIVFLPLILYHLAHQSLPMFVQETFVSVTTLLDQRYASMFSYGFILESIKILLSRSLVVQDFLNVFYWLILLGIPFLSGAACFYCLISFGKERVVYLALPLTAVFYGLVSVHFAIPIYLYFSTGFLLVGLIWMAVVSGLSKRWVGSILGVSIILGVISLAFHVARPIASNFLDAIDRNKVDLVYGGKQIPRLNIWVDPKDLKTYGKLVNVIEQYAPSSQTIFAFPYNPEIYFLSNRKNPFPFYNTQCVIHSKDDVKKLISQIREAAPALICYNSKDKRNTDSILAIINEIKTYYQYYGTVSDFEIYLRPDIAHRPSKS